MDERRYAAPPEIKGKCPECQRWFTLNRDGRLRIHDKRQGHLSVCPGEWPVWA